MPSPSTNPLIYDPLGWGSLQELSLLLGRPYSTTFKLLLHGTLADFGIRCYLDVHKRWWVTIPPSLLH